MTRKIFKDFTNALLPIIKDNCSPKGYRMLKNAMVESQVEGEVGAEAEKFIENHLQTEGYTTVREGKPIDIYGFNGEEILLVSVKYKTNCKFSTPPASNDAEERFDCVENIIERGLKKLEESYPIRKIRYNVCPDEDGNFDIDDEIEFFNS